MPCAYCGEWVDTAAAWRHFPQTGPWRRTGLDTAVAWRELHDFRVDEDGRVWILHCLPTCAVAHLQRRVDALVKHVLRAQLQLGAARTLGEANYTLPDLAEDVRALVREVLELQKTVSDATAELTRAWTAIGDNANQMPDA